MGAVLQEMCVIHNNKAGKHFDTERESDTKRAEISATKRDEA